MSKSINIIWAVFGQILLLTYISPLFSCSIPVFRYALERWTSDPYVLVVRHPHVLSEEDKALITDLSLTALENDSLAAYKFATIPDTVETSTIELYFPEKTGIEQIVWQAKLNRNNIKELFSSPVRQKISNNLLGGDAISWIVLVDPATDQELIKSFQETLNQLEKELRVPSSGIDSTGQMIYNDSFSDYEIRFSLFTLDRNDSQEELLIRNLLLTEWDLMLFDQPIAFPVFGRGRVLYSLVGKGINEQNIRNSCNAILGWCSCQIKDDNPGMDLFFNVDWSNPVGGQLVPPDTLPPLTGFSEFADSKIIKSIPETTLVEQKQTEEEKTIEPVPETIDSMVDTCQEPLSQLTPQSAEKSWWSKLVIILIFLGLILVGGTIWFISRKKLL